MRSKAKNATRLVLYVGLLCLEVSFILGFYVIPQYETRNGPPGHWEAETPFHGASAVEWVGIIAFFALVLLANVGLVSAIWREVKNLRANDS